MAIRHDRSAARRGNGSNKAELCIIRTDNVPASYSFRAFTFNYRPARHGNHFSVLGVSESHSDNRSRLSSVNIGLNFTKACSELYDIAFENRKLALQGSLAGPSSSIRTFCEEVLNKVIRGPTLGESSDLSR
jgi:hypothetical protein